MKEIFVIGLLIIVLFSLAACAAGPNEMAGAEDEEGEVAGFWKGLWHGLIALITFTISLFSDNVNVYEVHNNGGWYNFGFILGLLISLGGGGNRTRSRRD